MCLLLCFCPFTEKYVQIRLFICFFLFNLLSANFKPTHRAKGLTAVMITEKSRRLHVGKCGGGSMR